MLFRCSMKNVVFTLILSLLFLSLSAQDFEIVSVESLPADMSAREEMKTDHNDHQCALLRVATQHISPEQRERFIFKSDLGSEVVERASRNGEIWIWVSPGLKYLRIQHPDWGQYELRLIDHVARVEALHAYKIIIKGTLTLPLQEQGNKVPTQQYLAFRISPTNATLFVNDELWEVGSDGSAVRFVNFGTYNYRVMAPNYLPETGTVTVNDPDNTQTVPVSLKPDFVEVTLKVDADAEIWVNNEKKGTRTWTGKLGKGNYKIECKQAGHETSIMTKEITADLNEQIIKLPKPTPIYGSLNIESTPNFATIYIDGKMVGETPKFVKEILIGRHEIKLLKEGHEDYNKSVEITRGCNIQVVASLEKYNAQHLYDLGIEYFNSQNYEKAIECYSKAAEQGLPEAQNELGNMYYFGLGVERDFSKALNYYRNAAKAGYVNAQYSLGNCYLLGDGIDRDNKEAIKWIKKAAEQGNVFAQNSMGEFYLKGLAGLSQNYTEALRWYQKAANKGDSQAQTNLGCMYLNGYGVDVDYFKSTKYFRLAAEQGDATAQCNLGLCYYYGLGVSINYSEASKWLHLAANNGNEHAKTLIKDLNL